MERSYNNSRSAREENDRRMYDKIREEIYRDAFREGYKAGRAEGYNLGYEHASNDHRHNEQAARKKHHMDMHWHGKQSKSWSWI